MPAAMTEEQIKEAKYLRSKGTGWHKLSRIMGISEWYLTETLEPERIKLMKARNLEFQRKWRLEHKQTAGRAAPSKIVPPPEVIDERNRAYFAEVPVSVTLMGDPLPGRSALDKKINL